MTPPRGTLSLQEAAKVLFSRGCQTGPSSIFEQLHARGILMRSNMPYETYIKRGWFRVERSSFEHPTQGHTLYVRTFITDAGLRALEKMLPRTVKQSLPVRPARKVQIKWQPQVELEWPICVLGM